MTEFVPYSFNQSFGFQKTYGSIVRMGFSKGSEGVIWVWRNLTEGSIQFQWRNLSEIEESDQNDNSSITEKRQSIRIVTLDIPPFYFKHPKDGTVGISVDIIQEFKLYFKNYDVELKVIESCKGKYF